MVVQGNLGRLAKFDILQPPGCQYNGWFELCLDCVYMPKHKDPMLLNRLFGYVHKFAAEH